MNVTIIIPTNNRWDAFLDTLGAPARTDYSANCCEVVSVDDRSTDARAVVEEFAEHAAIARRYTRESPFGPDRDALFRAFHERHAVHQLWEAAGTTTQNVLMVVEDFHGLGGFYESFTIARLPSESRGK